MKRMFFYKLLFCFLALTIVPLNVQYNDALAQEAINAGDDVANSADDKAELERLKQKYADRPNGMVSAAKFAAPQKITSPKISPDGNSIAYIENKGKTFDLVIADTKTRKGQRFEASEITSFSWLGNRRILTRVSGIFRAYNLYIYDIDNRTYMPIGHEGFSFTGTDLLYLDPEGEYFLEAKQESIFQNPSVFRVDVKGNIITRIVKPQKGITSWFADKNGVVRIGLTSSGHKIKVYYRRSNDEKFFLTGKINTKDPDDKTRQALFAFNAIVTDSDEGYVLSNQDTGRFALYKYNYFTGEIGEKIFYHESNDITDYHLNAKGDALLSVNYTEDKDRIIWFDKELANIQKNLEKALPGQEIWLQSRSRDGNYTVVYTISSTDPGSYYLFNKAEGVLDRIGGVNDYIDPKKMSVSKYVQYKARDGITIHSYLTLPNGRDAKNLPLIIMPHGGPYGVRDNGDYDPQVQFLVNRGYAVLQPNFRGSDSYGEAFYELGEGQIGRKMQDDLDDGMDWLVKRSIVDPARVCIVGASYGGYAALWGAIRNPERYRCAVSFAGVTEFDKQLKYDKQFFSSRHARAWKETVRGDKSFDLDDVSPAKQVHRLKRPVLLSHGDADSIVPFKQYELMVKAANKANVEIETHVYEGEGHGLSDEDNRIDWYNRLEAFLQKHNPAFVENP
jgi:dipeptidyl aminopeptidase/acylaminoacyl peptidase